MWLECPVYRAMKGSSGGSCCLSEIGAGWLKTASSSGKEYVSLSLAAPEFGPRRLYANLGQAAGSDNPDFYAVIWNPVD